MIKKKRPQRSLEEILQGKMLVDPKALAAHMEALKKEKVMEREMARRRRNAPAHEKHLHYS